MLRQIHCRELTKLGVISREAENGREAVELCRSGETFDLIFMDSEMPFMNGLEATRVLREMKVSSKIVGVTAQSREWEIKEFMEAGLDYYLEKPLTKHKIVSILQEIYSSSLLLHKETGSSTNQSTLNRSTQLQDTDPKSQEQVEEQITTDD
ncbi:hypothetical protein ACHQM5_015004 [Ranunculus cassubicifolius]